MAKRNETASYEAIILELKDIEAKMFNYLNRAQFSLQKSYFKFSLSFVFA